MIRVQLYLDSSDCLTGISAGGHSGLAGKGNDILCAAASAVLRTVGKLISTHRKIVSQGSAGRPGELELRLISRDAVDTPWLKGITDFCTVALFDLMEEYPGRILVTRSRETPPEIPV